MINLGGWAYRLYNPFDLLTNNIAREFGQYAKIGVSIENVGYGFPNFQDYICLTGCWTQELIVVSPDNPVVINVSGSTSSTSSYTPSPSPTPTTSTPSPSPSPTPANGDGWHVTLDNGAKFYMDSAPTTGTNKTIRWVTNPQWGFNQGYLSERIYKSNRKVNHLLRKIAGNSIQYIEQGPVQVTSDGNNWVMDLEYANQSSITEAEYIAYGGVVQ